MPNPTVQGGQETSPEYGCVRDLGGIDGPLYITDMAWRRASITLRRGHRYQEITAKILARHRKELQLRWVSSNGDDPGWAFLRRYPRAPACSARSRTLPLTTARSSNSNLH